MIFDFCFFVLCFVSSRVSDVMATKGNIGPFIPAQEDIKVYLFRLEQFFNANDLSALALPDSLPDRANAETQAAHRDATAAARTREAIRHSWLIRMIGDEIVKVMTDLSSPASLNDKSFGQLCELLKKKFSQCKSTLLIRPKIFLRHDQTIDPSSTAYQDSKVQIVAPQWVQEGLRQLSEYIPAGTQFTVYDNTNCKLKNVIITDELTLKDLVMIARNEPVNVSGEVQYENYAPLIADTNKKVIHAIKDLVRQCIIVARDETVNYGGYPFGRNPVIKQSEPVYVADLAGLQFQTEYNSGRLVLIGKNLPQGLLDDLIFKEIVGERKVSFQEASGDASGRYVYVKHKGVYFDTIAYERFVANDVVMSGLAFNAIANEPLNFKFLKYGTGFFAGDYARILEKHIYDGVAIGLNKLFSSGEQKWIKQIELPFYVKNQSIDDICKRHGIKSRFSEDDALKKTHCKYTTATTNCADPHAITGNEMGYSSVDAAICSNLKSKGNIFSPVINLLIKEKFIQVDSECTNCGSRQSEL